MACAHTVAQALRKGLSHPQPIEKLGSVVNSPTGPGVESQPQNDFGIFYTQF